MNASGVLDGYDDGYARFLNYLKNLEPSDELTGEIAAAVEVLRDRSDLRREYMTFQEIIDKEKEISLQEGEARVLHKLSVALNMSEEKLRELIESSSAE